MWSCLIVTINSKLSRTNLPLHSGTLESHFFPTQRNLAFPNKSWLFSQENATSFPSRNRTLFPCNLPLYGGLSWGQIPVQSLACFLIESEEWSSQLIFQFKQLERRSLRKSGLQRDSSPWPPRYRCDALPSELWSHTLGARSIYWVHIFPCSEMMWSLYEIIHICTAVGDESEEWSSQ